VRHELQRGLGDWEQRLNTALIPVAPGDLGRDRDDEPHDAETVGSGRR
jgi:hypothetical protein